MKTNLRYLYIVLFCFSVLNIKAQHAQLWGVTAGGNTTNYFGNIFHFNSDTNNLRVDYTFPLVNDARSPEYTKLTDGLNGKLYGMTSAGGLNDKGVIFEYDTATNIFTKKIDLYAFGAESPYGSLTLYNGIFYGLTRTGGASGFGTLFMWDPNSNAFSIKHDFLGGNDGSYPVANLTAFNGKLYGTTTQGGGSGFNGIIFEFDPLSFSYAKKKGLNYYSGENCSSSFIVLGNKLYTTAGQDGPNGNGSLIEYTPSLDTLITRAGFNGSNGQYPTTEPILFNNKLYGTTVSGGANNAGVIYEIDTATFTITKLVDFGPANGSTANGGLCIVGNKLYGLTNNAGGGNNFGTLYEYIPSTSTYTVKILGDNINEFSYCSGTLTNVNGTLYGMSNFNYKGNIFKYNPTINNHQVKVKFSTFSEGSYANGSLVFYNGKYYGLSASGGINNSGVLFEYNPLTATYTKKIDFIGSNGSGPYGSMVVNNGLLYGMTMGGGLNNKGIIFQFNPATNTLTKKIDFDGTNGSQPSGDLTFFNNKFYGMTSNGGANNLGVLFEWDTTLNTITTKVDFDGINGSWPNASLIIYNNKLFGMTNTGGTDDAGVIFEFDPTLTVNNLTVLYEFQLGTTGKYPLGNLSVFNGKLYGTTETGGSTDNGVIFEYNLLTNVYTRKISFDGTNKGSYPGGTLKACNGKFYGLTRRGGTSDSGVLFEWNPITNAFVKRINFDGTNGERPSYTTLIASNAVPVLNNTPSNQTICAGSVQNILFDITDADNDPLSFLTASSNISLIPNAGINITNVSGSTYQISFTPLPGQTDSSTITVIANDGNNGEVSFSFQVVVSSPLNQSMCLVTVDDSSTHNIIIWEKPITTAIDSFKIWRVQTASIDTLVGTVAYDSLSEFHDYSCNPNVTQYDYKISVLDTCGNESAKSLIHRTILMTTVPGFNQVVLNWNQYVLNNITNGGVNQYRVWRDSTLTGNWQQIAQLSPASTTYIDNNWPGTGSWRYRIDVDWTNVCTPTARTDAAATNTTRSNTRDNYRLTGLSQLNANSVNLFPNPASELVNVNLNANAYINNINLIDATGRLVKVIASTNKNNQAQINAGDLARGIYFIEVNTNAGIVRKSFVRE